MGGLRRGVAIPTAEGATFSPLQAHFAETSKKEIN